MRLNVVELPEGRSSHRFIRRHVFLSFCPANRIRAIEPNMFQSHVMQFFSKFVLVNQITKTGIPLSKNCPYFLGNSVKSNSNMFDKNSNLISILEGKPALCVSQSLTGNWCEQFAIRIRS